jgi:DNA polymerase III delta prime subunit
MLNKDKIVRYKLYIPIEDAGASAPDAFKALKDEYETAFESSIKIEKDGSAFLTKEELNRIDIMIQRKFGTEIGRQEKITCSVKIAPRSVQDKLRADLNSMGKRINVDYDREDNLLCLSIREDRFAKERNDRFAKIPRELMNKYGLKPIGVFCKYAKTDEFHKCFIEIEKQSVKIPTVPNLEKETQKMLSLAFVKKAELEKEDYESVRFSVGQTYAFADLDDELDDSFWESVKTDIYGLDISASPKDNLLFFDFTSFDSLQEKLDHLNRNDRFKLVKAEINNLYFKVHLFQVEKKSKLDSFEYKKERLKNIEFVTRVAIKNKLEYVYIGNLIGKESSEGRLAFSIPYRWKDEQKKAKNILKLFEDENFSIENIQANLKGDEVKLSWLDEAVKKLDEKRIGSREPNKKPVNPRLRDFLFDSSKATPTYELEGLDEDISRLDEYKELENRQLLQLNQSQKLAVLKALYAKDLCLLQGPPGTGKTTVIAELIWQHILNDSTKRLLLTSETNLAVDNALEKLMGSRNVNEALSPFLSIIKPLRFGASSKFEEDGKKYSVERIEKWLDDEYEEDLIYENEIASLDSAEEENLDNQEDDDVNNNAVQQWMKMIAQRAQAYAIQNPKYAELVNAYCASLCSPDGITKRYFKEKYFKHANVIGSTCSSTGSPSFAADYARVYSSAIYDKFVEKEGYKQTISDIKGLIVAANNSDNIFQETALSIIKKIMNENNVKTEEELRELLDNPTDNVRHFLFNYDLRFLLRPKRPKKFDTILERLGFDSEDEFNQLKNIYFDTVIMDEASKATPPDLVLPLCFGKKSIVIGDHRQLPPMLNEQDFKEALLSLNDDKATALANDIDRQFVDTSQFARLILNPNVSKSIKSVFTEQYRMHPQINDVIKQFYKNDEGGLSCGLDLTKVDSPNLSEPESRYHGFFHPGFISPNVHVLWVKVDEPEQRSDSKALYNEKEVEAVKRVLQYLKHSEGFETYMQYWDNNIRSEERRNLEKEIGVISFYGQQVKCLNEIKSFARNNGMRVKLNTVDKFQGMERNIVIVSTVRSNKYKTMQGIVPNDNPGFAKSPERLNVALSRARRLLIVVGNNEFFDHVKDIYSGNLLYHNVIDEMQKHHEIIDYQTLTKYI